MKDDSTAQRASRLGEPMQEVLSQLRSRIGSLRLRETHHAQHAAYHLGEQKKYAEQLAELEAHYEALTHAASAALEIVETNAVPAPLAAVRYSPDKRINIRKLVVSALEWLMPGEPFSATFLARHLNQSLHGTGHPAVTIPQVATVLRRLAGERRVQLARAGKPHHEALYARLDTLEEKG